MQHQSLSAVAALLQMHSNISEMMLAQSVYKEIILFELRKYQINKKYNKTKSFLI